MKRVHPAWLVMAALSLVACDDDEQLFGAQDETFFNNASLVIAITDSNTGVAFEGATCTIYQRVSISTTSGSDGACQFSDIDATNTLVVVAAEGYSTVQVKVAANEFAPTVTGIAASVNINNTTADGDAFVDTDDGAEIIAKGADVGSQVGPPGAVVHVQLAPAVQATVPRMIAGRVFVGELRPAGGAEVVLTLDGDVFATATTDADGGFVFDSVPFENASVNYSIWATPFDADGDGWPDTGIEVIDGLCVFGVTDDDNCDYDSVESGLTNIILDLAQPDYELRKSNACADDEFGYGTVFIRADEAIYLLWDTSVNRDQFVYRVRGVNGAEVPTTPTWVGDGNYLVSITPDSGAWTTSDDNDDEYELVIESLVFTDGVVDVDATDGDTFTCDFQVGVPPVRFASPAPEIYLETEQQSLDAEVATIIDADSIFYLDAEGNIRRQDDFDDDNIFIRWDHVPGATRYRLWAIGSVGDDLEWIEVGNVDVGDNFVDTHVIGQANFDDSDLYGDDIGDVEQDEVLGNGNVITLVVTAGDINHQAPRPLGTEPTLTFQDGWRPTVADLSTDLENDDSGPLRFSTAGNTSSQLLYQLEVEFEMSESMIGSALPSTFGIRSGQFSGVDTAGPSSFVVYGQRNDFERIDERVDLFEFNDARLVVDVPADIVVTTNTGGDNILLTGEIPTSADISDFYIGQELRRSDGGTITVTEINTTARTLVFNAPPADNTTLFPNYSRVTDLTAVALPGQNQLQVRNGALFFDGQGLELGVEEDDSNEFVTVQSISGNTITLTGDLNETHEVGALVFDDSSLDSTGTISLRGSTELNDNNDRLIQPVTLTAGQPATFEFFRNTNSFNDVQVGDVVLIAANNDNDIIVQRDQVAYAEIIGIETIQGNGTDGIELAPPGNVQEIDRLLLGAVVFTGTDAGTATTMELDPSEVFILHMGDLFVFNDATVSDTSGNTGVNPEANAINIDDDVISIP